MNASRHFFSKIRIRVKSRFSCAFLPPARLHALVPLLLDTSSPPSAFSVHSLFSLFLLLHLFSFPSQSLPVNDTSLFTHLFSVSFTLLFFLFFPYYFMFITFPFCYVESSLRKGDVLRHHSSIASIVGNGVFASVRN